MTKAGTDRFKAMKYKITKQLPERFKVTVSVNVLLVQDKKYLLLKRAHTGWADGYYTLPAGHLEGNEQLTQAAAREVKEEVGVSVRSEALALVHVMHRSNREDDYERIDFYFLANEWKSEPYIAEPEKADRLDWFTAAELPENTLENVKRTIHSYQSQLLSEINWESISNE